MMKADNEEKKIGDALNKEENNKERNDEKCGDTSQQLPGKRDFKSLDKVDRVQHRCSLCDENFRTKKLLSEHQLAIHNLKQAKMHKCTSCDKRFHRPMHLQIHMRVHTGEKPVHCQPCQKNFPSKTALVRHQKTTAHLKMEKGMDVKVEKQYLCEECGSRFCLLQTLTRHMEVIHKESKHFQCSYCDYSSKYETNLKRHIESHENIKHFICEICGLSFHTRSCLRKHHSWIHSDKRDFVCELCSKAFKGKNSLLRHLRDHSEDRPFKCFCNKTYKRMSHLKRHVESAHKITVSSKKLKKIDFSNSKPESPVTDSLSSIDDFQTSEFPDMLLQRDDLLSSLNTDEKSVIPTSNYVINFSESLQETSNVLEEACMLDLPSEKDSSEFLQQPSTLLVNPEAVWSVDANSSPLKISLPALFLQQPYDCESESDVCLWANNNFMSHEYKDMASTRKLDNEAKTVVQTLSSHCSDDGPIDAEQSNSEWLFCKMPTKTNSEGNGFYSANDEFSLLSQHTEPDVELDFLTPIFVD